MPSMRFDDGPTNSQANSYSVLLGREKGIEELIFKPLYSAPGIRNREQNVSIRLPFRMDP